MASTSLSSTKSPDGGTRHDVGFLIISRPYTTTFQTIGIYHKLAYLSPVGRWDLTVDKLVVCVWLGPEQLTIDIPDTTVFLIWPEKKIIVRIAILSFANPSDLTTIDLQKSSHENTITPDSSIIFHELVNINTTPCLLFISQVNNTSMNQIFTKSSIFSFSTYALKTVIDCMTFFEGHIADGDALHSEILRKWFADTSKKLDEQDPSKYLFDPTVLLVGIINHLRAAIIENHTFDIQGKKSILIPFIFIRGWFNILSALLKGPEKDNTVKRLLDMGKQDN